MAMGAPDRRLTEHWDPETDEVDHRLVKLVSQISDGVRQITFDTDAYRCKTLLSHDAAPAPTDDATAYHHLAPLSRAERNDHFTGVRRPADGPEDREETRPHAVRAHAEGGQDQFSDASTSSVRSRDQRHWIVWTAASLSLFGAAGLATAWSPDLLRRPLSALTALARTGTTSPAAGTAAQPANAKLLVQDQTGAINEPLALGVSLNGASGSEIVVLDGLPQGAQLSLGRSLSASRWSLSAAELNQAFIAPPKDFAGHMELSVKLYASSNNELIDTKTAHFAWPPGSEDRSPPGSMRVADRGPELPRTGQDFPIKSSKPIWLATDYDAMTPQPNGALDPVPPSKTANATPWIGTPAPAPNQNSRNQPAAAQIPTQASPGQEIAALVENGEALLRQGDIAEARLPLRRAAEAGSAKAAVDLGMTFDPAYLRQNRSGMVPDLAQATQWYIKAKDLGADVSRQLERLSRMHDVGAR